MQSPEKGQRPLFMEGIQVKIYRVGVAQNIILLKISGFVDTTTSPGLQKTITSLIEEGNYQFLVDMTDVQYVSSAGWGVFVGEIRGLREKSGDLKIANMIPEVVEVFEMLEFNRIISGYDSVEEAIDDFEFCMGIPLSNSRNIVASDDNVVPQQSVQAPSQMQPAIKPATKTQPVQKEASAPPVVPATRQRAVSDAELPLTEKVKKLVIENPILGIWSIKKMLYSPRFGYTKIGYFKLRALMKKLALETRRKRIRYYRSRG